MRRSFNSRKTTAITWAAAVLTLAVCGVGMLITYLQYRDVSHLILELNRQNAQRVQNVVAARLTELEAELVGRLVRDRDRMRDLARHVADEPIVENPFFVSASGDIRNPLVPRLDPGARMTGEDELPRNFEDVLRRVWSGGSVSSQLAELGKLSTSTALAERWRLRASSLIAALLAREGRLTEAVTGYRRLFTDFRTTITENPRPSYLQLTLAYGETLLRAGEGREIEKVLTRALDRLLRNELPTTTEEELFFLRRTRSLFERTGAAPPEVLDRLDARHRSEREVLLVASAVRNRIDRSGQIGGGSPGQPRRFYEVVHRRPVLAVWSIPEPAEAPRGEDVAVAGFLANADAVAAEATRFLAETASAMFVVRARVDLGEEDDRFVPLVPLGEGHGFLEICLPREAWDRRVGQARRPFLFAGGLIGLFAVALILCLVVIQRGVREELLLSKMKTEFVANVSHELKTPLALIRMFAETLLLGRVSEKSQQEKYYTIITRESERLSHLIANVLNFSSMEAGKKSYQLRRLNLRSVIEEVVERYRYGLDAKGFELRRDIDDELPDVDADPEAVSQALINLLENSIKYSPKEKSLQLSVRAVDGAVEVALADRGVGIAAEDQERVLEDYYRTREARALGTRGSGLGLSVVQHIMEAHGGRVRLESEPGQGSCFTLVFPVASRSRDRGVETEAGPPEGAPPPDHGKATT